MAKLPSVVSSIAPDLRAFINRVREAIDGKDGSRLVSVDELVRSGIAGTGPGGVLAPPVTGVVSTPPAPKTLTATGGVYNVFVEWEDPRYLGHAYTEVWGAATDDIGAAVSLGIAPGVNFTDPLSPGSVRYYWIRFVNIRGTIGAYNAIAGTRGETQPEVGHLLEVLNESITESELFADLGARIDQIDVGPDALIPRVTSLRGKFTVKIDNNGYVSGFGLASTENNATPFSDFGIRADRFYVASPSGPGITPMIPFKVITTPQVINGTNVPVGVYIDGAHIQGGSITGSAIVNGSIEGTKLINVSANQITGAALLSTSYIESAGYIPGSQGWKIGGNGVAEFAAASIRGQLSAAQMNGRGLTILDNNNNVILNAGTGDFTGSVYGTAASTLVNTANTAYNVAYTANGNANTAINGLGNKLNSDARNVLSGYGGLAAGTLNWNSQGQRISGYGIGFTQGGFAAFNQAGQATFALSSATGDASFAGTITAGTIGGSNVGSTYVQSANFSPSSSGWQIASNGNAEFNQLTVRSGQVVGALLKSVSFYNYSGLYVYVNGSTPGSFNGGPYYWYGQGPPLYLVGSVTMPAPETAAHRIAVVSNVQASGGSRSKDLQLFIVANGSISGTTIYGEEIAEATSTGTFGMVTTAAGASNQTYTTSVPVLFFVGGFNMDYTVQTIRGLLFGIR